MINVIYNKNVLAFQQNESHEPGTTYLEPFETFGTPYGLFVPVTLSGYQFVRWLRRDMKDTLPVQCVGAHLIHISNDGEVLVVHADTEDNNISMVPVCSEKFQLINASREVSGAYTRLLRDCKTIAEACQFVEEHEVNGIPDPHIVLVSDWVEYAKTKEWDKVFYFTKFRGRRFNKG